MKPFHFSKLNILFEDTFFLKKPQKTPNPVLLEMRKEHFIIILLLEYLPVHCKS